MKNINNLVKEAYDVFAGHQPKAEIDACTCCCMTTEDAQTLVSLPVDEIPLAVLRKYQDAATPDKIDQGELKYFAPRYLELIKSYQYPSFEPALALTRFGKIKPNDWTKTERQLLNDFAISFFHQFLHTKSEKANAGVMRVLLMFYKGGIDIQPLFKLWDSIPRRTTNDHFDALFMWIGKDKKGKSEILNPYAEKDFNRQLLSWLSKHEKIS